VKWSKSEGKWSEICPKHYVIHYIVKKATIVKITLAWRTSFQKQQNNDSSNNSNDDDDILAKSSNRQLLNIKPQPYSILPKITIRSFCPTKATTTHEIF
jgi:hypothetical protein